MELLSIAMLVEQKFLRTLLDAANTDASHHIGWQVIAKSTSDCFDIDDSLGDVLGIEVAEVEVDHIFFHGILGFLITSKDTLCDEVDHYSRTLLVDGDVLHVRINLGLEIRFH